MIEETAVIVKTQGRYAWAATQRGTVCGQCSAAKGCGTSVVATWFGIRHDTVRVLNPIEAAEGDHVVLGLDQQALLRGSLAVYLAPLLFLFGALFLVASIFSLLQIDYSIGWQAITVLLGMVAGMGWLKLYSLRMADDRRYQAVVLRKVDSPIVLLSRAESIQ